MGLAQSTARLASALPDFSAPPRLRPRPAEAAETAARPQAILAPVPNEADIAERIQAEVARAESETAQRLSQEHAAAINALRAAHADEIVRLEAAAGAALGEAIAARFAAAEARLADLTLSVATRLIGAMLSDGLRDRAVDQLAAAIRGAIGDSDAVLVTVRGPQSLYEALAAALGPRAAQIVFTEGPGPDLAVAVDEAQFETRLAEWADAIGGIVA